MQISHVAALSSPKIIHLALELQSSLRMESVNVHAGRSNSEDNETHLDPDKLAAWVVWRLRLVLAVEELVVLALDWIILASIVSRPSCPAWPRNLITYLITDDEAIRNPIGHGLLIEPVRAIAGTKRSQLPVLRSASEGRRGAGQVAEDKGLQEFAVGFAADGEQAADGAEVVAVEDVALR